MFIMAEIINTYYQQKMDRQNELSTKEKRNKFINRYKVFIQKVNETQKKYVAKVTSFKGDIKLIIQNLYNFLTEYGFLFFFNVFISQPKCSKTETPIISKIIFMAENLIINEPQTLSHKFQTVFALCQLLETYLKGLQNFLNQARCESNMKVGQSSRDRLIKAIQNMKKMTVKTAYSSLQNHHKIIESQRSKKFINLANFILESISLINSNNKSATTQKQQFLQCSKQILKIQPQNILEEKVLNYYKQITQRSLKKGNKNLAHCCSILVTRMEEYLKQQGKYHEHKNYHWPILMPTIVKHVKKTIVGFLNLDGGIIYIGMKENPNNVQSVGIFLTDKEVIEIFQWIRMLCESIYPQFASGKNVDSENMYKKELKKLQKRTQLQEASQYVVNQYVAVEYLSVIDKETYEDCYEQVQGVLKRLYLIRIKIKAGSKFDTFHLLKEDKQKNGQIQCFKRNDASVNKLTLEEFFKLYNERFLLFLNEEVNQNSKENVCPKVHFDF